MELTWTGGLDPETATAYFGWCEGRQIGQVLRRRKGWEALVANGRIDRVHHPTAGEARAAVERAVAGRPLPQAPRAERRRFINNRGPGWAPHPGQLRRPPS